MMQIDTSRWKKFLFCPEAYRQRYVLGIEKAGDREALDFGTRMHTLLEIRLLNMKSTFDQGATTPLLNPVLEAEAQAMFASYEAFYPVEDFEVLDVERTFRVPIADTPHEVVGKFDGIVRYLPDHSHFPCALAIAEHKTQKRGSKGNDPEAWTARMQKSLYAWAAEQLYGEPVVHVLLDVLQRGSEGGRCPPEFRRDDLETDERQKLRALDSIVWVADQIETLMVSRGPEAEWPMHTESCKVFNFKCEFYQLCHFGRSDEVLRQFRPAEEYLSM